MRRAASAQGGFVVGSPCAGDEAAAVGHILAIDGPAGAGKSTISRRAAERLGFTLLDTGAIYRAVALAALRRGWREGDALDWLASVAVRLDPPAVWLGEEDVSALIRTPEVSQAASRVSAIPEVRAHLLELQRRAGRAHPRGAVVEGRDIGTVVFPDAEAKIYLTASPEERARRRAEELRAQGVDTSAEQILREQAERDDRDSRRSVAPLRAAEDARLVDTTGRGVDEILDEIVGFAARRFGA